MTRMKIMAAVIVPWILFLIGCPQRERRMIVIVIDMSASVDSDGRAQAFESISTWFTQNRLKRGDRIAVIPVTGDAWSDSQGMIQRFTVSEKREAYDADMTLLQVEVKQQLEKMERSAAERPYQKTDLFGALKLATSEFQEASKDRTKTIIVLSDMIQDDETANLKTAPYLDNNVAAISEAKRLALAQNNDFSGCDVFLGFLRSKDLRKLRPKRRDALSAFWEEFFRQAKAAHISTAIDGPGQIDSIFANANS